MQTTWNNLVNNALLGTQKKQASRTDFPDGLAPAWDAIQQQQPDATDAFLQMAAVTSAYRQSGVLPLTATDNSITVAPAEEQAYCGNFASSVLHDILAEESTPLLHYWLIQCAFKKQLVWPEFIPDLLTNAVSDTNIRDLVNQCCGNRGTWLAGLNPAWNFATPVDAATRWHTGTADQRNQVLREQRSEDAAKGRELLQETWNQENAVTRASLLAQMEINLSKKDLPWLETLLTDKSQKVKDEALRLMALIPESPLVMQYWSVLQQAVILTKSKSLLSSKRNLQMALPPDADPGIYKHGIQKLSNEKGFTDDEFIIYQLIESVPPLFFEDAFQADPADIIGWFQQEKKHKKFVAALAVAALHFKDLRWINALAEHAEIFYIGLLEFLPETLQDKFAVISFTSDPDATMRIVGQYTRKWPLDLARAIFSFTAKQPYQYSRNFYHLHIRRIPEAIAPELEKLGPEEEYSKNLWNNMRHYIQKLIAIKANTIRAFNS